MAIREVIANAIDEQILTGTRDVEIFLSIRTANGILEDFCRGLKYEHLTQKENEEKFSNPHVIGTFGIGLKDALGQKEEPVTHFTSNAKWVT